MSFVDEWDFVNTPTIFGNKAQDVVDILPAGDCDDDDEDSDYDND